jgi:hypothetical protein
MRESAGPAWRAKPAGGRVISKSGRLSLRAATGGEAISNHEIASVAALLRHDRPAAPLPLTGEGLG